jgi:hypothetical protein
MLAFLRASRTAPTFAWPRTTQKLPDGDFCGEASRRIRKKPFAKSASPLLRAFPVAGIKAAVTFIKV